jgi:hypothetical protein
MGEPNPLSTSIEIDHLSPRTTTAGALDHWTCCRLGAEFPVPDRGEWLTPYLATVAVDGIVI